MKAFESELQLQLESYVAGGYEVSYVMVDHSSAASVLFKHNGRIVSTATLPVCSGSRIGEFLVHLSAIADLFVATPGLTIKDTPPWAEEEATKLAERAAYLSKNAAALHEKLDDSMGSDFKVFAAMGKAARGSAGAAIVPRLVGDWQRHTEWHYSVVAACGTRVNFWPSTCKAAITRPDGSGTSVGGSRYVSQLLTKYGVMK